MSVAGKSPIRDPKDLYPLTLAETIDAAYIVSGDKDLLDLQQHKQTKIIKLADFRTVIYRKTKVSDPDEKVTNSSEKVTNLDKKVTNLGGEVTKHGGKGDKMRLTAKQQKVLEFCNEMPRTAQEILDMLGVKNQTKARQQYTTKLVVMGMLRPTTTASHDPNRKYVTSHGERDD